ncbi:hypothetical protein COCON_G00236070 [Conger conger]|uniref:Uncharacterized protein n=1 Tax=Conger conger TaxID=82655 RepID=A0A9Q1CTU1_CONCO|nr:hypothetical protein COCON_G00236070 [Conger conger]
MTLCFPDTPACNMASSSNSGFVVLTHVYPQQSGAAAPAVCTTQHVTSVMGKFLKGDPKALGVRFPYYFTLHSPGGVLQAEMLLQQHPDCS